MNLFGDGHIRFHKGKREGQGHVIACKKSGSLKKVACHSLRADWGREKRSFLWAATALCLTLDNVLKSLPAKSNKPKSAC